MDKLRLVYEQSGKAIWCSHLDTMRTLQRVMNRAGVPIKYSEGFNPHAQISILMPLSVGAESVCQLVEIQVREDIDLAGLPRQLNCVMPEGLRVLDCYENGMKPVNLKWMRISGRLEYDNIDTHKAAEALTELFSGEVVVNRRTKRGEGPFTITEHIREIRFSPAEGQVNVDGVISCVDPVVNPELITASVIQNLPALAPDGSRFCRRELYTADGNIFR